MSLQTSRNYFFLLFLFTLISCEDPNDIGLNLQNGKQLGTALDKTQTIEAGTVVHPDSILAFRGSPITVGKITDGDFGVISATHYTDVLLNGNTVVLDAAPGSQADSLVLVMAYAGYYYGDTTQQITLNVHRLDEGFEENKSYFTSSKPATPVDQLPLLGSVTFKPKFNRVNRNGKTFSRLIRIPLSQSFANDLLAKSGTADFSSQAAFKDFWKGIVITPAPGSNAGSVVGFNTLPDSAGSLLGRVAGINLYFKNQAGETLYHNFGLGSNYYNGNTADRQGSPLAVLDQPTKLLPAAQNNNQVYLQNNTGIKTRLTFPDLANFKEQKGGSNIFINHAELVLPVKNQSGGTQVLRAPSAVYFFESTKTNRVLKSTGGTAISIQRGNASAFGLNAPARAPFDADSSFYKVDITSYIQAVVDGKKQNNGIIVTAAPEDKVSALGANVGFPESSTLNRAIISTEKNQPIQLRIYYSQLK